MMEDDGGAPEDGGVISVGELGDGRSFEEDCAAERGERRVGEVTVREWTPCAIRRGMLQCADGKTPGRLVGEADRGAREGRRRGGDRSASRREGADAHLVAVAASEEGA